MWSFVERLREKNAKMNVELCAVLLTLRSMDVELSISAFENCGSCLNGFVWWLT